MKLLAWFVLVLVVAVWVAYLGHVTSQPRLAVDREPEPHATAPAPPWTLYDTFQVGVLLFLLSAGFYVEHLYEQWTSRPGKPDTETSPENDGDGQA